MTEPEPDTTPLTLESFFARDWASTSLGPPDTWPIELRRSVRFIMASAQPIFILVEPDGLLLFNEPFRLAMGPRAYEGLGQRIDKVWPETWDLREPLVRAIRSGTSGIIKDHPLPTIASNQQEVRYCTLAYVPLETVKNEFIGGCCTVEDRTEDVLLRRAIASDRDRLRDLFERSHAYIAMTEGPEHRYVVANAAHRRLLGDENLIGRPMGENLLEGARSDYAALFDRVYIHGEHITSTERQIQVRRADTGELVTRYVDSTFEPVRSADGTIVGMFVEGYDVTERHKAREHIESLQTELIHLSRVSAMNTMGSALAHELNQPLASVSNYLAAGRRIAERSSSDPDLVPCLERAAGEARRAGDIIRKLRDLTVRVGAGKADVPLAATVREAVKFGLTGAVNVTVDYDLGGVRTVAADAIQLQQVLINLVRNSCDAASDQPLRITIGAEQSNGLVEISVRDDGPGIDPEILATMFDSFTSAKPDGMGIGLSICRTIVESHGGHITAHNNPDRGATLKFTLPVEK